MTTTCQDSLQAVAHVPPSVQTVYCTLYGHQPMTGRQLRDATHLPRRTIYAALQRLRELGVIQERASLRDTRQTYYWVAGQDPVSPLMPPASAPSPVPSKPASSPSWPFGPSRT
jgi:predicted transcriptional regulator